MAVVAVEVHRETSYAEGEDFGEFGPFKRIDGRLHYAVDPHGKENSCIVDIGLAPTESGGLVRFSGDFTLVAPTRRPPRCLLLEVPNRGNRLSFRIFNQANPQELLTDPCSPGDGFLFRQGVALLSVGWQFDAVGMCLKVPEALERGRSIAGEVVCQIQPSKNTNNLFLGQLGPASYRPNANAQSAARLFERPNTNKDQCAWSCSDWEFGKWVEGERQESDDHICSSKEFTAGNVYTLVYNTTGAPVVGLGLLALRDAASYFRSDKYPGSTSPPPLVIGFGASQTGRVLRHMLYEGLWKSEDGRPAYDGLMPHIAGGQRGDFNHRFAQPSSIGVPACGQTFPFAGRTTTDSLTGMTEGLYRDRENVPKVMITNTSWEYWRGDAALSHITTDGMRDIDPLPNERIYLFAGTHHINSVLPVTNRFALTGDQVRYPMNTISYSPLIRSALMNMIEWVEGNSSPPQSRIPGIAEGTLVPREVVIEKFAHSDRFEHLPDQDALTRLSTLYLGPKSTAGICQFPAIQGHPYPAMVSDIGDDLNEIAGIRLPDLAVPLGVHTGWNPRHSDHGAEDQIAQFVGFSVFDKDLAGRYSDSGYMHAVRAVVDQLVEERFVLEGDRESLLQTADSRRALARTQVGKG